MSLSTGDKVRIALAPLHVLVGAALVYHFVIGPRTPMVAVLGVLFIAFGVYRITLIRRALKSERGRR
jgi:hypothetical protein